MNTQRASYKQLRATGGDLTQQEKVLRYLAEHGRAIKDTIAAGLGLRHSSVTARLNELVKVGRVREYAVVWNPDTRRHVTLYDLA